MKTEVFERGFFYHIYNRGNNKENLFKEDKNYSYFLKLMEKYLLETMDIYAYCLLPNHFHLLVRFKEEIPIHKKIHLPLSNMFNAYSKAINKMYKRNGSLFKEHLQRKRINSEEYLKQLIIYIHLNPEKHNIDRGFSKYKHSSYLGYLSNQESILNKDYIIELFDGEDNFKYIHHQKKINLKVLKDIDELDYIES